MSAHVKVGQLLAGADGLAGNRAISKLDDECLARRDLLAVELRDGLLGKVFVGVGHKGAAPRLAIVVAQDVELHDVADRGE